MAQLLDGHGVAIRIGSEPFTHREFTPVREISRKELLSRPILSLINQLPISCTDSAPVRTSAMQQITGVLENAATTINATDH